MGKKKISLNSEQMGQLFLNGRCNVLGEVYEVSHLSDVYVKIDANGELVRVDAPVKKPVGRPRKTTILSKSERGLFVDKVGKFVVGQVVDVLSQTERKVEILRAEFKQASSITDEEWHEMGCVWTSERVADNCKSLYLITNGLSMKDEVGLYWYKEISCE
jgi:hypothetical protein